MKTKLIILAMLFLSVQLIAQDFKVEKVSGDVKLLRGTSENWETVKKGEALSPSDFVLTEKKSFIQLLKGGDRFLLKENAAIGLNYIKKVSTDDLILALALDEIRSVPKIKKNDNSKNTAVYGADRNLELLNQIDDLGEKKINGAKILNENGFKESSIIAAKETFRKHPVVNNNFEYRIYFADILNELKLYQEAASEYSKIKKLELNNDQLKVVDEKLEEVSLKIMEK